MGNCSFKGVVPSEEHHCSTKTIRVVSDSGRVFQFYEPVLVQKFLVDFPGFGVFRQMGRLETPLSGHESLVGGQIYHLLPLLKKQKRSSEVEETEQDQNTEEEEKKNQIVKTQISATKTEPMIEFSKKEVKSEAEIDTKKKKNLIAKSHSFTSSKTEQELEEVTEIVTKKKKNQIVKTQFCAKKTEQDLEEGTETVTEKKKKKNQIMKTQFCSSKTEQNPEEGTEMVTKKKNQIIKTQFFSSKTEQDLEEGTEIVTKAKSQIEPARMSSVEQLTNGSELEVLPSKGNGVWRVKLVINTKQLEEIFSEQVNTEALIEKMRSAASSSSESLTPRTSRSGWGVNWKPRVYNVFKLQNESCGDRK